MKDSSRRSFVKTSAATGLTFTFAGLIRAHGQSGGGNTTWNPEGTFFSTNSGETTTYDPNGTYVTTEPGVTTTWDPDATTVPEITTTAPEEMTTVPETTLAYYVQGSPAGDEDLDDLGEGYSQSGLLPIPHVIAGYAKVKFDLNPPDGKGQEVSVVAKLEIDVYGDEDDQGNDIGPLISEEVILIGACHPFIATHNYTEPILLEFNYKKEQEYHTDHYTATFALTLQEYSSPTSKMLKGNAKLIINHTLRDQGEGYEGDLDDPIESEVPVEMKVEEIQGVP
jgi:hypothetical protein